MSAFIISNESLTNIRNYIALALIEYNRPETDAINEANAFVKSWAKMNSYAILCRYGDRIPPAKLGAFSHNGITMYQFYRSLCCLQYQCSEGDTSTKHKKAWKSLKEHISNVAILIANEHSEVRNAKWE